MLQSKIKYGAWIGSFFTLILLIISSTASASVLCPPFTGPVADFCNVRVRDQLCVNGDIIVGGIVIGGNGLGYANTLIVDKNGNDALATRDNQLHFLTISAALAQALPGDVVWVFPGIYTETITIPSGVQVRGIAPNKSILQQLNVTEDTDLVTMLEGSQLHELIIVLTSTQDVQLRGIVVPEGDVDGSVSISASSIIIDNSSAALGNSNVYGVHFEGDETGGHIDTMNNVNITITSTGSGAKRGILMDTGIILVGTNCLIQLTGGTNSIGIESNHPAAFIAMGSGGSGGATADISQTQGTLGVAGMYFLNSTANDLGFTTLTQPNTFIWGNTDVIGGSSTFFLRPGTSELADDPVLITASQKYLAKAISVHALVAPGVGESTTITVQRKTPSDMDPVDTILSVTLVGDGDAGTMAINEAVSVHFDKGDEMSVKVETSAGANTSAVSVVVDIY